MQSKDDLKVYQLGERKALLEKSNKLAQDNLKLMSQINSVNL